MEYNNIINEFWETHGNAETERFADLSMDIVDEIHHALEKKNWTQKELANAIGKAPAEISKWLSGLHNLTLKSIIKLEMALDTHLIMTETIAKDKFDPSTVNMISFGNISRVELQIPNYEEVGEKNPMKVVYKKAS